MKRLRGRPLVYNIDKLIVLDNPEEHTDEQLLAMLPASKRECLEGYVEGWSYKQAIKEGSKVSSSMYSNYKYDPVVKELVSRMIRAKAMYFKQTVGNKDWRVTKLGEVGNEIRRFVDNYKDVNGLPHKATSAFTDLIREYRNIMKDIATECGQLVEKKETDRIREVVYVSNIAPHVADLQPKEIEVTNVTIKDEEKLIENVTEDVPVSPLESLGKDVIDGGTAEDKGGGIHAGATAGGDAQDDRAVQVCVDNGGIPVGEV